MVVLEYSGCALVVRKLLNSSRITLFKMSPLISCHRFVAEPHGEAGLVDAAESHRKTLPL